MGYSVERQRVPAVLAAMALGSMTLAGCNRLKPSGESEAMSLLRDGSEKVCVAPDVQKALRNQILPKLSDFAGDETPEEKSGAIGEVTLSFDMTTLQSFDKGVAKASCDTTVTVDNGQNRGQKFNVEYQITPSADVAGDFVVTAETDGPKQAALELAQFVLVQNDRVRQDEIDGENLKAEKARLLATVTPTWLMGTWITTDRPATDCGTNNALRFENKHQVEGAFGIGQWALSKDQIHFLTVNSGRTMDATGTISEADPVSFTMQMPNQTPLVLRRCTAAEMQTVSDATLPAADPEDASHD